MRIVYVLREGKSVLGMAKAVRDYLKKEEGMEARLLELQNKEYVIQARGKGGRVRQLVGMDKEATVCLAPLGEGKVSVKIGRGKWWSKGLVMTASLFVCWPLCLSSAAGMYGQSRLPRRIQKAAQVYLFSGQLR